MDSMLIISLIAAVLIILVAYLFSGSDAPPKKKEKSESNEKNKTKGASQNRTQPKGIDDPPKKSEMNAISKDIRGALTRLKTEYPPDCRLIIGIRGIIFSGDIKKLYSIAKGGFIEIATQLARRLIDDDSSSSTNFMNLIASIGAICTMDDHAFKAQAGNKELIKTLSDAYEKYKNGTYFRKQDSDKFVSTVTILLAGITVADEPVLPILKSPNLFKLCSKAIYQPSSRIPAVLFYMNASYEDYGRELLRKCKPKFFEALVGFLAQIPMSYPDAYEQIYLTLSNLYLHSDNEFKTGFTKTLLEAGFFELLARDIRRLQLDAIGLTMNIFQDNQLYEGVLSHNLLAAIAHAASLKQCGKQNLENIGGILYNLVITKKVPQALLECNAQEPLEKLTECPDKSVAEYAEVLLTKVGTLSGEIGTIERKCSSTTCEVRSDKLKKCSQCSSAWYCSKECQVNDWAQHKQACMQLKEQDAGVSKKQANMDRTVGLKFLHEHVPDFDLQARRQHLNLNECVIVVDFTRPVREKTTIYSIDKFYSEVIKKAPFSRSGSDSDLPRLRQSHTNCGQPAFIGVVIQATSIGGYVIPLVLQTR
eukprot:Phypoly_transcript_06087.p1 GENE.Phypoly_transcript_06087~~Phypoly_transcript_06087.p1  ORF type:complete len:611 (+),score=75.80 Phypoly_transcript_06087:61-1833(+)